MNLLTPGTCQISHVVYNSLRTLIVLGLILQIDRRLCFVVVTVYMLCLLCVFLHFIVFTYIIRNTLVVL